MSKSTLPAPTLTPTSKRNVSTTEVLPKSANPEVFKQLGAIKQAALVSKLLTPTRNQKDVAKILKISVPQVSNLQTLDEMPVDLKLLISSGKITSTLVLEISRELAGKSNDEISEAILNIYNQKGSKITKRDFQAHVEKYNSLGYLRKFLKRNNKSSIKHNQVTFGFIEGLFKGDLSEQAIKNFFTKPPKTNS